MSREENVSIFEDTRKLYTENESLKKAIENSIKDTRIILEGDELVCEKKDEVKTKVNIENIRSFEAARKLLESGCESVCVHNFASATNPGGGVLKGSSAQEEGLCRISTLYPLLSTKDAFNRFYKPHRENGNAIHNDDCIYTPNVIVFKSDTNNPKVLKEEDWISVNVITCAAPNLRENPNNLMNKNEHKEAISLTEKELYNIHVKRLKRILDIAYFSGNDAVVIGAFGCGAFRNNPRIVARATKDVLKEYDGMFKMISLAIYCTPKDDTNYRVFKGLLGWDYDS